MGLEPAGLFAILRTGFEGAALANKCRWRRSGFVGNVFFPFTYPFASFCFLFFFLLFFSPCAVHFGQLRVCPLGLFVAYNREFIFPLFILSHFLRLIGGRLPPIFLTPTNEKGEPLISATRNDDGQVRTASSPGGGEGCIVQ